MTRKRKRILFLAEGITMAHFTRPAALAQALDPAEWDVFFWTPRRYHGLFRSTESELGDLPTQTPEKFLRLLARGGVLYDADTIRAYVRADRAIFEDVRPDLVVGDHRLSLCISAPLHRVPFASIFNAYWSPHRDQPAIVPALPITRWVSPSVLSRFYAHLQPSVYAWHARPLNEVRRQHGLPELPRDIRRVYMAGDMVLHPDIPELVPLRELPAHHHFIGSCPWRGDVSKPVWWDEAMASPRPKVFVALGSSGPIRALPAILDALSRLPVTVLLATSGRTAPRVDDNVYAADLLPYEETARNCAAVVSHGGSSSMYPCLSVGTPLLAIPANIDTHLSAAVLGESGAGVVVRVEDASSRVLQAALARLLSDRRFKDASTKHAATIGRYDTKQIFVRLLRRWFDHKAGDLRACDAPP